jgi:NADH-quinone oxidoreductase subunit I
VPPPLKPFGGLRRVLGRLIARRRPVAGVTFGLRGVPRLTRGSDGAPRCVACALCAGACPSRCIVVEAGPPAGGGAVDERSRAPIRFELDLGKCLLCGLCEAACPEGAITLSGPPVSGAAHATDLCLDLDALLEPA